MKPFVHRVDLTELSNYQRTKICNCEKPCRTGVSISTYNDGIVLCYNDARKYLYNLIATLDEPRCTTWTEEDEWYVIDQYKEHGAYYGIIREIATALGKSYQQVKSKVYKLRKKGLI